MPAESEIISPDGIPLQKTAPEIKVGEVSTEVKTEVKPATTEEAKTEETKVDEKPVEEVTDFTEFLNTGNTLKEEVKKEEKKEETKEVKKEEVVDTDKRDYTGFDEAEIPLLKKMGNETFNRYKPIILEAKKLKSEIATRDAELKNLREGKVILPENYNEHPNSFVLTPEFEVAAQDAQKANAILQHWETQLERFRSGEKTIQNIHIEPKTGELYLSKEVEITPKTEAELLRLLSMAQNQALQQQNRVSAIQTSHTSRYQNAVSWVKDFESKSFPIFDKEEAGYKPLVEDTIKSFPTTFHKNPLAPLLAKALITTMQLGKLLKTAATNGGVVATKTEVTATGKVKPSAEDVKKLGPTISTTATTQSKDDESVDIDDFEKARLGLSN